MKAVWVSWECWVACVAEVVQQEWKPAPSWVSHFLVFGVCELRMWGWLGVIGQTCQMQQLGWWTWRSSLVAGGWMQLMLIQMLVSYGLRCWMRMC